MSARRRLLLMPAAGLVAALLWTTAGSFSTASGQEDGQPIMVERAHRGSLRPSFDRPIFILVLGSDSRSSNPAGAPARNDSIHIVAIDPKGLRATIVGVPRDSLIDIPGRGPDKAAHAMYFAGLDGAVRAFENVSGCQFDYRMLTAFEGFGGKGWQRAESRGGIINDIGGVTLNVPAGGFTDRFAFNRGRIPALKAGPQVLTGSQALAWSRARYARPQGDFDRSRAQGTLMIAILRELRKDFAQNPGTALRALAAMRRNVRMNIGLDEALGLGLLTLQINPAKVTNIVVEGTIGSHPSAGSVVRITPEGLRQLTDVCTDGVLDRR